MTLKILFNAQFVLEKFFFINLQKLLCGGSLCSMPYMFLNGLTLFQI